MDEQIKHACVFDKRRVSLPSIDPVHLFVGGDIKNSLAEAYFPFSTTAERMLYFCDTYACFPPIIHSVQKRWREGRVFLAASMHCRREKMRHPTAR